MPQPDRRRSRRLRMRVPVELDTRRGPVPAAMRDVSRPGIRVQVRTSDLGFLPTEDLGLAAKRLANVMHDKVRMRLHYEAIGPLVEKSARITRIAVPPEAPDCVELGCQFASPLTAEQLTMIGAPLLDEDGAAARGPRVRRMVRIQPPAPLEPPRPPVARSGAPGSPAAWTERRLWALIGGIGDESTTSTLCHADRVRHDAVRVRMSRRGYEDLSVPDAAVRITQRHGSEFSLKLTEGALPCYLGPVRLVGLELPEADRDEVLLTFAFTRALRAPEVEALGLVSGAA